MEQLFTSWNLKNHEIKKRDQTDFREFRGDVHESEFAQQYDGHVLLWLFGGGRPYGTSPH